MLATTLTVLAIVVIVWLVLALGAVVWFIAQLSKLARDMDAVNEAIDKELMK